ncbi:hypothetical protein K432DRAFT_455271, partial [Lepidopterella palustris CBS 459.81]
PNFRTPWPSSTTLFTLPRLLTKGHVTHLLPAARNYLISLFTTSLPLAIHSSAPLPAVDLMSSTEAFFARGNPPDTY